MNLIYKDFEARVGIVLPNSDAARAGIQVNDVIVSLNGIPTKTLQDYADAKGPRRRAVENLEVLRGDKIVKIVMLHDLEAPVPTDFQAVAEEMEAQRELDHKARNRAQNRKKS